MVAGGHTSLLPQISLNFQYPTKNGLKGSRDCFN